MKKLIFGGIAIWIISFVLMVFLFSWMCNKSAQELKSNYTKPDTTITIKNGKPDTTITIKKLPWWAK